ncbi:hypothetical protein [Haloparvum alkalitolerans]|uniref:hypothetical protein n=1 Tax=Haloparvum alkalitolerans TaxID=1042953 RepID=UPI003CF5444F
MGTADDDASEADAPAAGETSDGTDGRTADRATMADVSHRNPYTGDTMGAVFRRGPAVADGGVADGSGPDRGGEPSDESGRTPMREVDHTPRNDDVNAVWARGGRAAGPSGSQTGPSVSGVPGDD